MFNIRKIITIILFAFFSMGSLFSSPVWAKDSQPPIVGAYGVAIDASTGEILYNKNANVRAFPASMTKVLTSIVLDEKAKDNQMFTVSKYAAGQECSCFGLKAGEKISKKEAMYGLILLSANDMAVTIAENVGGSVPGFAKLMNAEIKKLGLKNTHFVTPNGLHDPNHYTTPNDMALIMKEALKHPNVLRALSTESIRVHTSLQNQIIYNNSMVLTQPKSAHVIAGKTGYTDQAGNTLVEYLKEGNKEVIAVVMKSHKINQYNDIQTMANYAFAHMSSKKIAFKGKVAGNTQINGEKVALISTEDMMLTYKNDDTLSTKIDVVCDNGEAIKKGQVVANLKVNLNGKVIKDIPLVTDQAIKKRVVPQKSNGFSKATVVPIVILVIIASYAVWTMKPRNRRKYKKSISEKHPA